MSVEPSELETALHEIVDNAVNTGWAAGAADMRERAARTVELSIYQSSQSKKIAAQIRALPLEAPSDDK